MNVKTCRRGARRSLGLAVAAAAAATVLPLAAATPAAADTRCNPRAAQLYGPLGVVSFSGNLTKVGEEGAVPDGPATATFSDATGLVETTTAGGVLPPTQFGEDGTGTRIKNLTWIVSGLSFELGSFKCDATGRVTSGFLEVSRQDGQVFRFSNGTVTRTV